MGGGKKSKDFKSRKQIENNRERVCNLFVCSLPDLQVVNAVGTRDKCRLRQICIFVILAPLWRGREIIYSQDLLVISVK